jgi:hypothetical protein
VGGRFLQATAFGVLPGGGLESLDRELPEAGSLGFGPALEFVGAGEVKPVEKGPGIERGRALEITASPGLEKLGEVALELTGIDQQLVGLRADQVGAQLAPEAVEGLSEGVPGLRLGRVGPEQEEELVPGDAVVAGGHDGRKEPEPPRTGPTDALVVPLQPKAAKGPKSEHEDPR